jgi:hypothetical protein
MLLRVLILFPPHRFALLPFINTLDRKLKSTETGFSLMALRSNAHDPYAVS